MVQLEIPLIGDHLPEKNPLLLPLCLRNPEVKVEHLHGTHENQCARCIPQQNTPGGLRKTCHFRRHSFSQ